MAGLLIALALLLRIGWVLLVPTRPVGDFALYVESAAHLVEHGAFDDAFIYMPGYVMLLAAVQALGGGVLSCKLVGAVIGGLGAGPVFGLADRLFDRRAALVAGAAYALWPAGIAVSSVTGTDMPAGVALATAVFVLVRDSDRRPWRAAIGFGLLSGLTATIRAVAAPLAALSLLFWLASRVRSAPAVARTAVSCAAALLVLLPWGLRNQARYGEFFLTDSHGGHTALVGANPDTDGVYSRSLNLMFWKGTGYKLFDPPHRASDRAAYDLAWSWARFEPAYAAGLVVAKADRLLTNERPLLYWPVYRQGVLTGATRAWFDARRYGFERLVDGFWYALAALATAGVVLAAARRRWPALAVLAFPLALIALYATFFSEVRYHLAIAVFLFPFAGAAVAAVAKMSTNRPPPRALAAALGAAVAAVALLFVGWPALVRAGASVRENHRWAVSVCSVGDRSSLCRWKAITPPPSPLRGVWNGVGLSLGDGQERTTARSEIALGPGVYRLTGTVDTVADAVRPETRFTLSAADKEVATLRLPGNSAERSQAIDARIVHSGGNLVLQATVERLSPAPQNLRPATVWLSDLAVTAIPGDDIKH